MAASASTDVDNFTVSVLLFMFFTGLLLGGYFAAYSSIFAAPIVFIAVACAAQAVVKNEGAIWVIFGGVALIYAVVWSGYFDGPAGKVASAIGQDVPESFGRTQRAVT